jgi:putative AlgH/UPF0301 family transcriptional regulator
MPRSNIEIPTFFAGHLLVAMPSMSDSRFERTVIYMCAHNPDGAMGLVINKPFEQLSFPDLLEQLNIDAGPRTKQIRLRAGGPVEAGRGFVLHSDDYMHDGSIATLPEVLDHYRAGGRRITTGPHPGDGSRNPHKSMFVTGFALSERDKRDLIAFLESLTDHAFLTNPAHADPAEQAPRSGTPAIR